jgi:hypothetical protein
MVAESRSDVPTTLMVSKEVNLMTGNHATSCPFDVLIPTFDGEKYLPHCLIAIAQSSIHPQRILIGSEGRLNDRRSIEDFGRYLGLTLEIHHSEMRLGLARNRARLLSESGADVVLWLDDDVLVSPDSIGCLTGLVPELGKTCSVLTSVGSNLFGHPTVSCGFGFTMFSRNILRDDPVLSHDFGLNTGEDCLWTARIVYKTGLPVRFVPTRLHHIGEVRRRKRYGVHWDGEVVARYTSSDFYNANREELDYSHPVYNYLDY